MPLICLLPAGISRLFEVLEVNTSTKITYLPEVFTKSLFEMMRYDEMF
jgi:hypothetical protein